MKEYEVDISLIITFHNEGILAQMTLNSIERCRLYAKEHGITSEYIWVMDNIDEETKRVLDNYPIDNNLVKKIEVSHGDLGASRNSGILNSRGESIAILDGDDYYSKNWLERAMHSLKEFGKDSILHPEMVLNFGTVHVYAWQMDQLCKYYDENGLLTGNYWTSWTFAHSDTYKRNPYIETNPMKTGFGFEDWHWNCETIANGFNHRTVSGTVAFYRRKHSSLLASSSNVKAIMPASKLFEKECIK